VIPNLERRYRETNSDFMRNKITEFMSDRPCPTCKGTRLRPEALAVTVDANIVEVTGWPVLAPCNGSSAWLAARSPFTPARWPSPSVS
jgi:excinuclease UvrABC ATPase subunit